MSNNTARILQKRRNDVLEQWMSNQLGDYTLREDLMTNEDLRSQSEELLNALIKAIGTDNYDDIDAIEYQPLLEILGGISLTRAHAGFTPRETGLFVFSLKKAITQVLVDEQRDTPSELVESVIKISSLIDNLGIFTFETFIKGREEVIIRQTSEIHEISTPVIKVWDGILALPIIGTLDSARTQVVMESLLEEIVNSGSTIAILDISGVPAVDSLVAQHLMKTVSATRLMGAECIISGIRPEIAQTIVHLGIDLSNIQTKSSLASALKYAFTINKLEVKKVSVNTGTLKHI
jgi:rsbT co-antagonist protein RsbR